VRRGRILGGFWLLCGSAAGTEPLIEVEIGFGEAILIAILLAVGVEFLERKIEAMAGGIEVAAALGGLVIECDGAGHLFLALCGDLALCLGPLLLELLEFAEIGFALATEAALLESKIAEFPTVNHVDFSHDEGLAIGGVGFVGEFAGEFAMAERVESGFERSDAEQAPFGVGDGLDEDVFVVIGRREFGEVAIKVLPIDGGIVGRQEDGAAGEAGFDGVHGGFGFAFRRFRPGTELGIGAVGGDAGFGGLRDAVDWLGESEAGRRLIGVGGSGGDCCFRATGWSLLRKWDTAGFEGLFEGLALSGATQGARRHMYGCLSKN
jgi:hypothetical protein